MTSSGMTLSPKQSTYYSVSLFSVAVSANVGKYRKKFHLTGLALHHPLSTNTDTSHRLSAVCRLCGERTLDFHLTGLAPHLGAPLSTNTNTSHRLSAMYGHVASGDRK